MATKNKKGIVLLIDNISGNNLLLQNILDMEGFSITTFLEPDEAVNVTKKMQPDLLLIDVMMPELKGFNVLKVIKADEETKDIPVIMVSTQSEAIDLNKAKRTGAVDLIVKPVDIRTIIGKIERILH